MWTNLRINKAGGAQSLVVSMLLWGLLLGTLPGSQSEIGRKILPYFQQEKGKSSYFEIHPNHSLFLKKIFPQ